MSSCENFESALRSDFKSMRVLATCSICDQLLYEPWTIACGHTYCYSCLCSWFSQDRRKKSCPECRSRVKVMPAPSFLIKQLVEVILKRSELLLADESVEQHQKKREEEVTLVDNDRNSSKGLFKGMFTAKQNRLWRDLADGVLRCSSCGFEHEGGPLCSNCGERIEVDEEYDVDEAGRETTELDSMEFGLEPESEDELFNFHDYHHFQNVSSFIDMAYSNRMADNLSHFRLNRDRDEDNLMAESDSEGTELSAASESSESEIDDADDNSLQDFIAPDDDGDEVDGYNDYESTTDVSHDDQQTHQSFRIRQQHTVTISDDGSDEGGAISNRRQRRRHNYTYSNFEPQSSLPSVITFTDVSSNQSEVSHRGNQAEILRHAGWSPLDHCNESDKQSDTLQNRNRIPCAFKDGEESETNTKPLVDESVSDEDDDSTQMENHSQSRISIYGSSSLPNSPQFYEFSDSNNSQSTDEDGDIGLSTYRLSRNSQAEKYPSASYESHTIDERSPYAEGIFRLTTSGNNGTRRKRAAWESSTQDTGDMESVETNFGSRQSKSWAISRMRHNYREDGLASRVSNEEPILSQGGNNYRDSHAETIGLANVLHEDVESDDTIQPPTRRHLRHRNSIISHRRVDSKNNTRIFEPQETLPSSHMDKPQMNQPKFRRMGYGSRAEGLSTYRNMSATLLHELSINSTSLSIGIAGDTSWATRTASRSSVRSCANSNELGPQNNLLW